MKPSHWPDWLVNTWAKSSIDGVEPGEDRRPVGPEPLEAGDGVGEDVLRQFLGLACAAAPAAKEPVDVGVVTAEGSLDIALHWLFLARRSRR